MKHGKKYTEAAKLIDRAAVYEAEEAISLVKKTATAKFDETVEINIRTSCDGRHADQQIRGAVVLPAGTGKKVRVLVFAKGAKLDEAQAAGADYVGGQELLPRIQNDGWLDFDVVVATPDMMSVVGRLGRILGPKGLMPNPKAGTVTMDVTKAINDIKAGKIEYRLDKSNIIHCPIGKASFSEEQLLSNYNALIDAIVKARPAAVKGQYIKSISLATTMGPQTGALAHRDGNEVFFRRRTRREAPLSDNAYRCEASIRGVRRRAFDRGACASVRQRL